MNRRVRCPKCRQMYWEGTVHVCSGTLQGGGLAPADDDGCLQAGCCLAEILSWGSWWVIAVVCLALLVRLV